MTMPENSGQQQQQGQGGDQGQDQQQQNSQQGKPFRAPQTQEEFNAMLADRLRRERDKFADYDDLKQKASEYETLRAQTQTEQEKAIATAKAEAKAEAIRELSPTIVAAEFRAVAAGRIDRARLDTAIEDMDFSKFIDAKGVVDHERVQTRVAALVGDDSVSTSSQGWNLGQGKRIQAKVSGKDAGRAEAARRFGKPQ